MWILPQPRILEFSCLEWFIIDKSDHQTTRLKLKKKHAAVEGAAAAERSAQRVALRESREVVRRGRFMGQ